MTELKGISERSNKMHFDCMQNDFVNKKNIKTFKISLAIISIIFTFLLCFAMIGWNNESKIAPAQASTEIVYTFSFAEFGVGVQDVQLKVNNVVQTKLTNADGIVTLNNLATGDIVSFMKEGYIFSEGGTDYIDQITIVNNKLLYNFVAWQIEDNSGNSFFYIKMVYNGEYLKADESTQYSINGGTGENLAKLEIPTSPNEYRVYASIDWAESDYEIVITTSNYYFPAVILEEGKISYTFEAERTYTYSFEMLDINGNPLINVQAYTQYEITDERVDAGFSSTQGIIFITGVRLGTTIFFELLGYSFENYSAQQEATDIIKRIAQYAEVDVKIKFIDYENQQIPICDETWTPIFAQLVFTRSDEQAVGEMGTGENIDYYLTMAKINDIFKFNIEGYDIEQAVMTRIPTDKTITVKVRQYLEIRGTLAYPANERREVIKILVNGEIKTETDDVGKFVLGGDAKILQGDKVTFLSKNYVANGFTATESEANWTGYLEKKEKDFSTLYIIFGAIFVVVLALPIFFARTRKKKRYLTEI